MVMQSKTRVDMRLKAKILNIMSNWDKDFGWSRKKKRADNAGLPYRVIIALGRSPPKQQHFKYQVFAKNYGQVFVIKIICK